jgi:aspartate/methionine/tyrosine aminotransferase
MKGLKIKSTFSRLKKMGIKVDHEPEATFYIWANLSDLPAPLDNGIQFFEEALTVNVICVPGIFFDINPGKRRELFFSPFHHYVRLSFGPPLEELLRVRSPFFFFCLFLKSLTGESFHSL